VTTATAPPIGAIYRAHRPGPPLADFVEHFWYTAGYRPGGAPRPDRGERPDRSERPDHSEHRERSERPEETERILPSGSMSLILNLREDRQRIVDPRHPERIQTTPGSILAGAHSEYVVVDAACLDTTLGIAFKPGGAFPFFRLPAGELHNTQAALADLWGPAAGVLRERLLAAPTPDHQFALLEAALLARAVRPLAPDPAVAFAVRQLQSSPTAILHLTHHLGLTPARFIRLFKDHVGLTPKLYHRLQRFQQALRRAHRLPGADRIDWSAVALGCGYFDQSHFNHDFRAFSGLNPTHYLAHRSDHQNHVALE
jgi:AraC-like DNA-binding protein